MAPCRVVRFQAVIVCVQWINIAQASQKLMSLLRNNRADEVQTPSSKDDVFRSEVTIKVRDDKCLYHM